MKKFGPIYKRTSTGKIQMWECYVDGDEYFTVSGQYDGKKVTSERTKAEAKNIGRANKTSPEQQAEIEAEAKYVLKKKKGYTPDLGKVDEVVSHKVLPMLAKEYKNYKDSLDYPVFSQPKYDGLRCVITREGAYSREWNKFNTLGHIQDILKPIFEKYPNIVAFDGEAYNHELKDDFNEIVSIIKQTKPTDEDLARAKELAQYHIYDVITADIALTFEERFAILQEVLKEIAGKEIFISKTTKVNKYDELDELYDEYLENGYEGQMVRANAVYKHSRTNWLLKRKEFQDKEFKIVGYKEGKGNRKGCMILLCVTDDGGEFECSCKGKVAYQKHLYSKGDQIVQKGLYATIKFQRYTPDGLPKFLTCKGFRNKPGGDEVKI